MRLENHVGTCGTVGDDWLIDQLDNMGCQWLAGKV